MTGKTPAPTLEQVTKSLMKLGMTREQSEMHIRFCEFVQDWTLEFNHRQKLGQAVLHTRDLGIAAMRFAEHVAALAPKTEGTEARAPIEIDWRDVRGFLQVG